MMEMNTPGMYRAHMDADGNLKSKIYKISDLFILKISHLLL